MSEIKYVDNPAKLLVETGLLFYINNQVLHPLGLALEVQFNENGGCISGLWDFRDDPEGLLYSQELIEQGKAKYKKFMEEEGNKKHQTRKELLGYVIQE